MSEKTETSPDKSRGGASRILGKILPYVTGALVGVGIVVAMDIPPRRAPETCPSPQERYEKGKACANRQFFGKANRRAAFAWMKSAADSISLAFAPHCTQAFHLSRRTGYTLHCTLSYHLFHHYDVYFD